MSAGAAAVATSTTRPMPPPVPGFGAAVAAVFRLQWRRIARGNKLRLALVALALLVVAIVWVRYAADVDDPVAVLDGTTRLGFFRLLVYLFPFLFTAGAISEEVESRTFAYIMARPVSRLAITLGKYLAGTAMAVGLLVVGLLVVHLVAYATDVTMLVDQFPGTLQRMGAITLNAMAYGAICMFWGALMVEAGWILATLYLAIVELGASLLISFIPLVSMNHHAIALAGFTESEPWLTIQIFPEPWVAAIVLPVVTLVYLFASVLVVSTSEYRSGKA